MRLQAPFRIRNCPRYGEPARKAFGKFFTRLRSEDDSVVLGRVPIEEREVLCAAEGG
jgi:hypothetical protein